MVREKQHSIRQHDFIEKATKNDDHIKDLSEKLRLYTSENNMMWDDIKCMSKLIPKGMLHSSITIEDRNQFTPKAQYKTYALPKSLINLKVYKGPEIKPQVPNVIVKSVKFKERLQGHRLTDMQVIQQHQNFMAEQRQMAIKTE